MDNEITSGSQDSGTAVTETPVSQTGTENAASGNTQSDSGSPQGLTEDSQQGQAGGRKKWSMQDTVKELRAERRELRERLQTFQSQLEELKQRETSRPSQNPVAKTPQNFWQDPEGTLQATLDERLNKMQEAMLDRFSQTREQEHAMQALRQEQAEGVEFIRSQKGYSPEDDEELIEIIDNNGLKSLTPMRAAQAAWAMLQQSRGIGDRSLAKQQASGVQGQAPSAGFGTKTWSLADFDAAASAVEKNPNDPKNKALLKELMAAHKEGRVK